MFFALCLVHVQFSTNGTNKHSQTFIITTKGTYAPFTREQSTFGRSTAKIFHGWIHTFISIQQRIRRCAIYMCRLKTYFIFLFAVSMRTTSPSDCVQLMKSFLWESTNEWECASANCIHSAFALVRELWTRIIAYGSYFPLVFPLVNDFTTREMD